MSSIRRGVRTITVALAFVSTAAHAQFSGSVEAQGEADIEAGANQPSDIELGAGARTRQRAEGDYGGGGGGGGDLRLAIQGRLDAINTLAVSDPGIDAPGPGPGLAATEGRRLLVPIVTPGVRLLDESRLFIGAGFGFSGISAEAGPNEDSRSGWSFSPLVSYDLLRDENAAFALLGWFNLASLGETEECNAGGCDDQNDDAFGWGLSVAAGLRGFVSEGLALGGEFGWGFLDIAFDPGLDVFAHGIFGNLFLEASIAL